MRGSRAVWETPPAMPDTFHAVRGPVLTFTGDPSTDGAAAVRHERDALLVCSGGRITHFGAAAALRPQLPADLPVEEYGPDHLILPGFIDCHVHYPQLQIIGAYGEQLLDWLEKYTFVAEQRFADPSHARLVAGLFLDECLRNGTTTVATFCTVHSHSVDALFEAAATRGMRVIAGKCLMDRHAPAALSDTAQRGYDESKALIDRWHDHGRALYAITPRFAPSSSPEQMELAGALWKERPGTYLQSHVSESRREVEWARELFPERRDYVDVYAHYGQLGPRAIYGHGIHLSESELQRLSESGTAIAHCPTSNLFLGSGLFDLANARQAARRVRVGLATDVGAGTSLSMLRTMGAAYQTAQLRGNRLSAIEAFHLATRGAAHALYLEDRIGSLAPGMEADFIVMNLKSTPLIDARLQRCESIEEALFVQMTLADDRAIAARVVNGRPIRVPAPPPS
jgi:guanine deaminase